MRGEKAQITKPTTDAVESLTRLFYEGNPSRLKNLEEARANDEIARKICELRTAAGLTQTQLGKLIGTTASVICRLEDADSLAERSADRDLNRAGDTRDERVEDRHRARGHGGEHDRPLPAVAAQERALAPR